MSMPSGYNGTSLLPVASGDIQPMRGGGINNENNNNQNNNAITTVTILGNTYKIRVNPSIDLTEDEKSLLDLFQVTPKIQETLGNDMIIDFFKALATYNCEKEEGVLLNPKCEPVRVILRAVLSDTFINDIDEIHKTNDLGPLGFSDNLHKKNILDSKDFLEEFLEGDSILEKILVGILHKRGKIEEGSDEFLESFLQVS